MTESIALEDETDVNGDVVGIGTDERLRPE